MNAVNYTGLLSAALIVATLAPPMAACAADIQMLPPLDFNANNPQPCNINATGTPTSGLLYWDGSSAIKCVPNTTGTAAGFIGIGTTAPASQLANNSANRLDYTGNGLSTTAINWTASAPGYVAGFENLSVGNYYNGLLVKTTDVSSNTNILDLIPFPDQNDVAIYGKEVIDLTTFGLRSM